ncbi:MAG: baseplate J/gp47 family protein [Bacteroidota bacterium]
MNKLHDKSGQIENASYSLNGSSRNNRSLKALSPDFFKIDERTLVDFLVFAEKYAAYLYADGYPESVNPEFSKSWKTFFASDVSVFLAKIIGGKPELSVTYSIIDGNALPKVVLRKLNVFLTLFSKLNDAATNSILLQSVDQKISLYIDEIEQLKSRAIKTFFEAGIELKHESIDALPVKRAISRKESIAKLDTKIDSFLASAHKIIYTAKTLFHESIQNNDRHNPAMALVISFLQLYEYTKDDLNAITGKHLDHFFKETLQQSPKPPEPDEVHVCLRLSDHVESYRIEEGTLFKAGVDDEGLDYLYEAKKGTTLNKTQITSMGVIYVSKKEDIKIEPYFEFISGIYQTKMLDSAGGGFDFTKRPFPILSQDHGEIVTSTMDVSDVGFAIASPVLILREGLREVTLGIQFNLKSMSPLVSFLERLSKREDLTADEVFHRVFSRAFTISLTTASRWMDIAEYTVMPHKWSSGTIVISFTLPMSAPAIEPMGEEWDKAEIEQYNTQWPIMKVGISDQETMYSYSYLKHLIVNEFDIDVDVKGIKQLEVYNDLGKVETSVPFFPFGPLPIVGSSFMIGYDELYTKDIENFSLEITWHNLPRNAGGFKEYYKEYDEGITNDSFRVVMTALSNHTFHPEGDKIPKFSLFSTLDADNKQSSAERIAPHTSINIKKEDVKSLNLNIELITPPLPPFDNTTKTGYLKLELKQPDMGFGHNEYSGLASLNLLRKAKNDELELPNPPYIPQMKSLSLNYKGSTKISFQKESPVKSNIEADEKVYQLQPFGVRTIFKDAMPETDYLLPQYDHDSYLLLGLEEVAPNETVTFCFELGQSAVIENEDNLPVIKWFYVYQDTWLPFEERNVISDSTKHFITSGIIELKMPSTINNDNTILPSGKYWIIAALIGHPKRVGKIKSVFTQALTLRWKRHKSTAMWKTNIPNFMIDSLVQSRSEIASVFQPMPSFGGRSEEAADDFYCRVSERLAHKNRGVTAWDIERLVLEKFPAVNHVKCISPIDQKELFEPGKIVLVVAPAVQQASESLELPKFNLAELKNIREYLYEHVSPFAKVEVINPVYEEVKITATVVGMEQTDRGNVEELHRDIQSYICPWYRNPNIDMMFGSAINLDEFIKYLKTLPYIQSLSGVSILIVHDNRDGHSLSDSFSSTDTNKTLFASRAWSVLAPMKDHQITIHEHELNLTPEKAAIENMRLGSEFVITEDENEHTNDGNLADDDLSMETEIFEIDL